MAQSLSKILLHIIFSTKNRRPFLDSAHIRCEMHAYLAGILHNQECPGLLIGGTPDHVHILCQLGRTITAADLIKEVKRSSSIWIKQKGGLLQKFDWQDGYGVFSIGRSQVDRVKTYIGNQENHHHHVSFQDEFRKFLRRYEIDFDERYVWD